MEGFVVLRNDINSEWVIVEGPFNQIDPSNESKGFEKEGKYFSIQEINSYSREIIMPIIKDIMRRISEYRKEINSFVKLRRLLIEMDERLKGND